MLRTAARLTSTDSGTAMSSAFAHLEAAKAQEPVLAESAPDWKAYLRASIKSDWRASEWFPDAWFFSGDVENPRTKIYRCPIPNCKLFSATRNGPCASCYGYLHKFPGDTAGLALAIEERVPTKRFGDVIERCSVELDGERCGRDAVHRTLCNSHYTTWSTGARKKGVPTTDWASSGVPVPLRELGVCSVPMCERGRGYETSILCAAHLGQFRRAKTSSASVRPAASEETFARTTAPIHTRGDFSLITLPETIRLEILVALQTEDRTGYLIDPPSITRLLPAIPSETISLLEPGFEKKLMTLNRANGTNRSAMVRRMFATLKHLRSRFENVDPTAGDVWDTYLAELPTERQKRGTIKATNAEKFLSKRASIDFTPIRQTWVRELAKRWARDMRPDVALVRDAIKGFSALSGAVALRENGDDPATAGTLDIDRAVVSITTLVNDKTGEPYTAAKRSAILTALRRALHYLWTGGLLPTGPGFFVSPDYRISRKGEKGEKAGRALPIRVVAALVEAIPQLPLGRGQGGSLVTATDLLKLHQTALRVLIDTGRRPNEVCTLRMGCVSAQETEESEGVRYTLTYDNHKSGRDGRTLPISEELGAVILQWEEHRRTMDLPAEFAEWLFPSPSAGRMDADGTLTVEGLKRALGRLVAAVPWLETDTPDKQTGGYLRFTGKIIPYSFRHSYAQRHADAGVGIKALAELMDHESISTTAGYFTVSEKTKREAADRIAPWTFTRHGDFAPTASGLAYEIASVAVPFGGCTDPSNVKAGGSACPIRFQCAGCDMYRPDPSYLPAIESHLKTLRANYQLVKIAGTAAPWVLHNMSDEIASFQAVVDKMTQQLAMLPDEERHDIDEASVAMRKAREHRPLLPLRVMR